jgi:hypothetical protein
MSPQVPNALANMLQDRDLFKIHTLILAHYFIRIRHDVQRSCHKVENVFPEEGGIWGRGNTLRRISVLFQVMQNVCREPLDVQL